MQEGARVVSGRAELSREDTCTRRFFFCEKGRCIKLEHSTTPLLQPDPRSKEKLQSSPHDYCSSSS